MKFSKINLIESIALILILTINRISMNNLQSILLFCGSSSILNVIFVSIITLFLIVVIIRLFKKFPNSDIIDICEVIGGKFLKWLVGSIFALYIIVTSSLLLRYFIETIHIIYYGDAPIIYLLLFFSVVSVIANMQGIKSIARTNVILCVIMVISLLTAFAAVVPNMTIQRIFPILGHGVSNTFFTGIANIFIFNGFSILFLVPPLLENKKDFKKSTLIATLISIFIVILATASMLLAFSFSTDIDRISPLYSLLSNNEFGKYFQHPESLFIFTWILSFMSYFNIGLMTSSLVCQKVTNVKNSTPFIIPICIISLIIALIPNSIMQTLAINDFISKYIGTPLTFIVFPIILMIANLKLKKGTNTNENLD